MAYKPKSGFNTTRKPAFDWFASGDVAKKQLAYMKESKAKAKSEAVSKKKKLPSGMRFDMEKGQWVAKRES